MYLVKIKKTRNDKFRVCLVSDANKKLVLQGEPISNLTDALRVAKNLREGKISKEPVEILPVNHTFPRNYGPGVKKIKISD